MIEYQTPIDAWTLLKIWVAAFSGKPPPWVHCLAIFTYVSALSLCLTILPGILRGKIYRLLSHVACTWAGLRGVSHPSSAAFPRLLTQCSAFKWPLIGCDCSASHPSEYFCNKSRNSISENPKPSDHAGQAAFYLNCITKDDFGLIFPQHKINSTRRIPFF